jgi:hypothetical protein
MSRFLTNWTPISKTDAEDIIHTAFVTERRPERNGCKKPFRKRGMLSPFVLKSFLDHKTCM